MRKPSPDGFLKQHKKKIIVFFYCMAVIGLIYLFIYSPIFKINKIVVRGTNESDIISQLQIISRSEILKRKWLILPKSNYLVFSSGELKNYINANLILDELEVDKKLLHTLKIYAKEKIPALQLEDSGANYYIDKNGLVTGAIDSTAIKYDLPKISYGTSTRVTVGSIILDKSDVGFIKNVFVKISDKFRGWRIIRAVFIDKKNSQLKFYTNEGWYLILNTEALVDKQLENLDALLRQKIQDRRELEYIDLRIEDKIFYK